MLGEQNQPPAMQPEEDRAADQQRDLNRKGTATRTDNATYSRRKLIAFACIFSAIIMTFLTGFTILPYSAQLGQAKRSEEIIYDALEVDSLIDFIQIKGDEEEGYYYEFVDDADEKLDKAVEMLENNRQKNR